MKTFIAFAFVAVIAGAYAFTEEQVKKGEAEVAACIKEFGVDPEAVQKLKGGDFSNKDEKLQCFTNCFLEKTGFIKDGKLLEDATIEKLSADGKAEKAAVEKLVGECKTLSGANNCETAFKIYECYHTKKSA